MTTRLQRGSRGPEVLQLQAWLNQRLSLQPRLAEDGDFGARTEIAVRRFQAMRSLSIDGVVGPRTWSSLQTTAAPPAQMCAVQPDAPWMAVAMAEVGQSELAAAQHNTRIIEYHATTGLQARTDETPWCSSFVNWCLRQSGKAGTNSAAALSWLNWGQAVDARAGAITVIFNAGAASSLTASGNHVGFLVQRTATHFVLLGGNQSNQVKISRYPASAWQLKGHRWPA